VKPDKQRINKAIFATGMVQFVWPLTSKQCERDASNRLVHGVILQAFKLREGKEQQAR
jgi:hypothetical protein